MDNRKAIADAVDRYAAAAKEYGAMTEAGNSKKANNANDRIYECLREIRRLTSGDVRELRALYEHPDRSVRLWAATHLLHYHGDTQALAVLGEVESGRGLVGFSARMVLQVWRDGNLRLPPGFE